MKEIWADIDGYNGKYRVSTLGNVKSLHGKGRLLKPYRGKYYWTVRIIKDGKYKTHRIHRLVALAFIHNPENKPNINHINFDRDDNQADNLEWCTQGENIWHTVRHGRNNPTIGETHPCAKLKESDVLKIRKMIKFGMPKRKVARIYNVSNVTIIGICNGRLWKHI